MPYIIKVESTFSAAHALRGYGGACERIHGHNFRVIAEAFFIELNDIGISIDFKVLKCIIDNILDEYDHQNLNDLPTFSTLNATAENIARTISDRLGPELERHGGKIRSITVEESAKYAATYYPDL